MSNTISTHVLDMVYGGPASGIAARLYKKDSENNWLEAGSGTTGPDGRISSFKGLKKAEEGLYRLDFNTADFFSKQSMKSCFPFVSIYFSIESSEEHYHIPLLLSPNGYTTYRGS